MQCSGHPACTFPTLTHRPPISFQRSPNTVPILRCRFHHHFLDLLLNEPFRQHSQLLRITTVPALLKLKFFVVEFNVSHDDGQSLFVNIDSRYPIGIAFLLAGMENVPGLH
jgi:hypothetical protein